MVNIISLCGFSLFLCFCAVELKCCIFNLMGSLEFWDSTIEVCEIGSSYFVMCFLIGQNW